MASRVTRNFLGALASGANAALQKNMALREDQQRYDLGRQRWRDEEAERRKLQLGYGEEDYGIERKREEGEYGVKRSRALNERKENLALKDAENQRLIDTGALIGKEIGDPDYALDNITKVLGLAPIPNKEIKDLERLIKQSQADYYKNRALNTGKAGNKGSNTAGNKGVLDELNQASTQMERIKRMIRDGKERNELGEETGRILSDGEIASLNSEYQKLFRYHSTLSSQLFGGAARDPQSFLEEAEGAVRGAGLADAFKPQPVNPMQHAVLKPGVEALSGLSGSTMANAGAGVPQSILFEILRQFTSPVKPLSGFNQIK